MINHYEAHVIIQDIKNQLQKKSFITFVVFCKILFRSTSTSDPLKIIYWNIL